MSEGIKSRKIAIVGASHMGLLCLRFMSRMGHDVTCFEQRPNIGGMWNFETTPEDRERGYGDLDSDGSTPCAYSQLCLNTSKYTFFHSDIFNDDLDLFKGKHWLSADEILQQQNYWVEKYNLMPFIHLNTEVVKIKKHINGWTVISKYGDKRTEEKFDFVILATGGFRYAKMPSYKNMDKFKGVSVHSTQVRLENKLFPDKNVLIVGGNFSGVDMAYLAAKNNAKNVYWSETRDRENCNNWLIDPCPADSNPDQPFDMSFSRYMWFDRPDLLQQHLNSFFVPLHEKNKGANVTLRLDKLGVTDVPYLLGQIESGKVQMLGPLQSITENGAITKSGQVLSDVDLIVYSTGVHAKFPLLNDFWPEDEQIRSELYYHLLPADDRLQGLAIICAVDGKGALGTLFELQVRWLCKFWLTRDYDSEGRIFTIDEMSKMKQAVQEIKAEKESANIPYKIILNVIGMFDMFANELGCLPPDYRELIRKGTQEDVELGIALMKGPVISMQYRLQGDDSYENATQFLVKRAKIQLGEEEFNSLVKRAMEDPTEFVQSHGIVNESYVVQPCFPSAININ